MHSWPPCIRGILRRVFQEIGPLSREQDTHFHTTTFSAGTYLALPFATLQSTVVVFNGVGILSTTLVADSLFPKFALTVTAYETCVVPISFTVGMTRNGSLILDVHRYLPGRMIILVKVLRDTSKTVHLISSNSPSGGIKLIVRVESNSVSRTHWWNRQSSSSTASLAPRSFWSMTSLSLRPNLHSGVPDRYARIWMCPSTSARRIVPRRKLDEQ